MDILKMTYVSYFFMILSAMSGLAAAVMYVVFDIRQCWRIVRGRDCSKRRCAAVGFQNSQSVTVSGSTERLTLERTIPLSACESTTLLTSEETVPLPDMSLVQDIVMGDIGRYRNENR